LVADQEVKDQDVPKLARRPTREGVEVAGLEAATSWVRFAPVRFGRESLGVFR
jgi:hypothetical protein